jgi:leader peptidase (prepilin peptidase)/N-methyltransferase
MPAPAQEAAWYGLPLLVVGWAALGWIAGIGINRIIHQLPRDLPPFGTPSCQSCSRPIAPIGWMSRACPSCGKPTGYDRTEWLAAGLFAVLAFRFSLSGSLVAYSVYSLVLIVVAAIDFRHRYVYSVIIYPGLVVAAILTPLLTGLDVGATLVGIGAGFGIFLVFYLAGRLLYHGIEPIGKGDIEIAALAGAMVGFPRVLTALFLGGVASAGVIAILLLARRRGRRDFVPYGPGMCLGTVWAFFVPP